MNLKTFRLLAAIMLCSFTFQVYAEGSKPFAEKPKEDFKPRKAVIINKTKQKLCLYAGNNVTTCSLLPEKEITVMVPSKVIYGSKSYVVSLYRVTDQGNIVEKGKTKVRQEITFCQKRDFTKGGSVWVIEGSGIEPDCLPSPQFKKDRPKGL